MDVSQETALFSALRRVRLVSGALVAARRAA